MMVGHYTNVSQIVYRVTNMVTAWSNSGKRDVSEKIFAISLCNLFYT